MTARKTKVAFIEPMLLLRTERLPDGKDWLYEVKFDGYRVLAIKRVAKCNCARATIITLRSGTPPARNWAHRSHTSVVEIKIYWGFKRVLLI